MATKGMSGGREAWSGTGGSWLGRDLKSRAGCHVEEKGMCEQMR